MTIGRLRDAAVRVNTSLEHEEAVRQKYKMRAYFPDTGPFRRELYPKHIACMDGGRVHRERLFMAANRVGKALRNGTLVATPAGWTPIDDLRVGQPVFAGDGSVTTVVGVYPQGRKALFRATFDGWHTVDCCEDHLWLYQHPRARYPYRRSHGVSQANPFYGEWRVTSAHSIYDALGATPITRQRAVMPTTAPWQFEATPVPLDPYVLGVLLGNGTLGAASVRLSTADREVVDRVRRRLPAGDRIHQPPSATVYDWHIIGDQRRNGTLEALRRIGLSDHDCFEKFIPPVYLLNSVDVRLALLCGLMDTDGSITTSGAMEYTSVSPRLIDGVEWLVTSLGGRCEREGRVTAFTYLGERRIGAPSVRLRIRLHVCPFLVARKAERWHERHNTPNRVLHALEPTGADDCTCIAVAHPSRTYVAAHGIVTHNTDMASYEISAHCTGLYPPWWTGKVFRTPIKVWIAGDTSKTVRDILQPKMVGEREALGTGMLPGYTLRHISYKANGAGMIDTVWVRHSTGGTSQIQFKSYAEGRESFQGTEQHVVWLDEEPPQEIYTECLLRTMTVNGIVLLTFTPLNGVTELVLSFLKSIQAPGAPEPTRG